MISNIDEFFHVASRNSEAAKSMRSAHLIHYAPHIEDMVTDAPLHVDTSIRHTISEGPALALTMPLEAVLAARRSTRAFSDHPLSAAQLWKLCYSATGVRRIADTESGRFYHRNTPSSGGMGAIESYVVAFRVAGLPEGIYHFDSISHDFGLIEAGLFTEWFSHDVVFQGEFAAAAAAIVLVGTFLNLRAKYGVRGYRSALIDAGHASQNIYLCGTAMELGICASTGFIDDELDEALRIDGVDRASLIVMLVGHRSESAVRLSY